MKSFLMLPLLIALCVVTCARVALGAPDEPPVVFCDETDIVNPDAISGADPAYQLISYQPGRDGLMDPFTDAGATAPISPAPATTVPDPTEDPGAFGGAIYAAAKAGKWLAAGGMFLMLLIAGLRWALKQKWSWFGTEKGGATAALGVTFLTVLATSMAAGIFDWTVILPAFAAFAASAIAIFVVPKKLKSQS